MEDELVSRGLLWITAQAKQASTSRVSPADYSECVWIYAVAVQVSRREGASRVMSVNEHRVLPGNTKKNLSRKIATKKYGLVFS